MLRSIKINALTLLFTRQYWAITYSNMLSIIYRYCYACLYVLCLPWTKFDLKRADMQIQAKQSFMLGSLMAYLNDRYGGGVSYSWASFYSGIKFYAQGYGDAVPFYAQGYGAGIPLSKFIGIIDAKEIHIKIPASIYETDLYAKFIAELEMLRPCGITYVIDEL